MAVTLSSLSIERPVRRPAGPRSKTASGNISDTLPTASYVALPWGPVLVVTGPSGLLAVDIHPPFDGDYVAAASTDPLHRQARLQLRAYARRLLTAFSLPIDPQGTPFQRTVWAALLNIPYGQTRTYAQIAAAIGHPGAARAVGMACRSNPIGLVIPCHRVVGADGSLTGYAGGLDLKARLLKHEGVQ